VDRRFGWDHFSAEKMRDPRIADMLKRVAFDPDPPPHPDRFPHRHGGTVTLELIDGRVIRSTCKAPRGSGARGIDWADVDLKYCTLMPASGLTAHSLDESLNLIHQLDTQSDVRPLMSLISPRADA
jgi:2-methylcitrate dehydratase PrpD